MVLGLAVGGGVSHERPAPQPAQGEPLTLHHGRAVEDHEALMARAVLVGQAAPGRQHGAVTGQLHQAGQGVVSQWLAPLRRDARGGHAPVVPHRSYKSVTSFTAGPPIRMGDAMAASPWSLIYA